MNSTDLAIDAFFREKYEALPRPKSWMPGPPSPWSTIPVKDRHLEIAKIENYIIHENQREFTVNEISRDELSDVEIENLGDNDNITKPSAVLVPLVLDESGDEVESIIVMTRSMSVSHHKGQVSFPGGMVEVSDADVVETALRETKEEIGIGSDSFTILGTRPPVHTRSKVGFITPVIASCKKAVVSSFTLSPSEVESIHLIDISEILSPDNYMCEVWDFGNMTATIHIFFVKDQQGNPVFIWGATAHILTDVLHCLK